MSTFMQPIKSFASSLGTYMNKRRDMELLMRLDDRTLADINISRELLDQGVKSWPWHLPAEVDAVATAARGIRAAVKELDSYTDSQLADLGISRGSITEAVLYGRPGVDQPTNDNGMAQAA